MFLLLKSTQLFASSGDSFCNHHMLTWSAPFLNFCYNHAVFVLLLPATTKAFATMATACGTGKHFLLEPAHLFTMISRHFCDNRQPEGSFLQTHRQKCGDRQSWPPELWPPPPELRLSSRGAAVTGTCYCMREAGEKYNKRAQRWQRPAARGWDLAGDDRRRGDKMRPAVLWGRAACSSMAVWCISYKRRHTGEKKGDHTATYRYILRCWRVAAYHSPFFMGWPFIALFSTNFWNVIDPSLKQFYLFSFHSLSIFPFFVFSLYVSFFFFIFPFYFFNYFRFLFFFLLF